MTAEPNLLTEVDPEARALVDRGAQKLSPAFPAERAAWGTGKSLRAWQAAALERYRETEPTDFLVVATPGAGKTSLALTVAQDLLSRRVIDRIIIVAPTDHLKTQWADAAARVGINIDPKFGVRQGRTSTDYQGIALTYAGVGVNPLALRIRTEQFRTLVILDEIHHAGDALSWGEAVREAFEPARRRLALTGTPFRSDTNPIPFVRYAEDAQGVLRSDADFAYGYADALSDRIVRPVLFMAYSGDMHWRTRAGDEIAARLGTAMTRDMAAQALRTALDPDGAWMPAVLQAADRRLSEVRAGVPDAGGLVIATDQTHARAYAALLKDITGTMPTLVLSDEAGSSKKISKFTDSDDRWMVAVRMVSEGVDVPRLSVGVYATATSTPLFFAQAIGRFVRSRSRGETASVFLPSAGHLLHLATEMETQRDHVLKIPSDAEVDEADLLAAAEREEDTSDALVDEEQGTFAALASEADFDKVVFDGNDFGMSAVAGSAEEQDYLGLPGLLEPDQVKDLLSRRQREHMERSEQQGDATAAPTAPAAHQQLRALRKELNGLVGAWHHRTDLPHGVIHAKLRTECGGPATAAASAEQLQERIDRIRQWAVTRS